LLSERKHGYIWLLLTMCTLSIANLQIGPATLYLDTTQNSIFDGQSIRRRSPTLAIYDGSPIWRHLSSGMSHRLPDNTELPYYLKYGSSLHHARVVGRFWPLSGNASVCLDCSRLVLACPAKSRNSFFIRRTKFSLVRR